MSFHSLNECIEHYRHLLSTPQNQSIISSQQISSNTSIYSSTTPSTNLSTHSTTNPPNLHSTIPQNTQPTNPTNTKSPKQPSHPLLHPFHQIAVNYLPPIDLSLAYKRIIQCLLDQSSFEECLEYCDEILTKFPFSSIPDPYNELNRTDDMNDYINLNHHNSGNNKTTILQYDHYLSYLESSLFNVEIQLMKCKVLLKMDKPKEASSLINKYILYKCTNIYIIYWLFFYSNIGFNIYKPPKSYTYIPLNFN